jgi:hypothetical protein
VAPAGASLKHAEKIAKGEVKLYQLGHFDIYAGQGFEAVITDQLEFLQRFVSP